MRKIDFLAKCYQEIHLSGKGNNSLWVVKMPATTTGRQSRDCQSVRFHNSTQCLLLLFYCHLYLNYTYQIGSTTKVIHIQILLQTNKQKSILAHFQMPTIAFGWNSKLARHIFLLARNPSFHVEFIEHPLSKTSSYSSRQGKKVIIFLFLK